MEAVPGAFRLPFRVTALWVNPLMVLVTTEGCTGSGFMVYVPLLRIPVASVTPVALVTRPGEVENLTSVLPDCL